MYCFDTMTYELYKIETQGKSPSKRTYHAACLVQNFMAVVAGEGDSLMADFHLLNLDTMKWHNPKLNFEGWKGFEQRRFHTATAIEPTLYSKVDDDVSESEFDPNQR